MLYHAARAFRRANLVKWTRLSGSRVLRNKVDPHIGPKDIKWLSDMGLRRYFGLGGPITSFTSSVRGGYWYFWANRVPLRLSKLITLILFDLDPLPTMRYAWNSIPAYSEQSARTYWLKTLKIGLKMAVFMRVFSVSAWYCSSKYAPEQL